VYCGEKATTVDHVRPLARGGWEHESNLVPACTFCNCSKNDSLLTTWRLSGRVAYGVTHSPKVEGEYARLLALGKPDGGENLEDEFAEFAGSFGAL
jgi:hypothetical protein